jgi:hypothetical protein
MRPFAPTEVTKYLLWVVLALAITIILVWRLFYAHGREGVHPQHYGATVQLHLPDPPHSAGLRPVA